MLLGLVRVNAHVCMCVWGVGEGQEGWDSFLSFCPSLPFPLPLPSITSGALWRIKEAKEGSLEITQWV